MSKRNAGEYQRSRKRKKEGYGKVDLDALVQRRDKVEDIRVWDVAMSETTGRVSGSRKTHHHVYESSPESHEEPPAEVTAPTDPESSELPPPASAAKPKRVRIRIMKENDSVSFTPTFSTKPMITRRQTKMKDWLAFCMIVLHELLRRDGLGDSTTPGTCAGCMKLTGEYRCNDCLGGNMYCLGCILASHCQLPLHRIEVRPGKLLVVRSR